MYTLDYTETTLLMHFVMVPDIYRLCCVIFTLAFVSEIDVTRLPSHSTSSPSVWCVPLIPLDQLFLFIVTLRSKKRINIALPVGRASSPRA